MIRFVKPLVFVAALSPFLWLVFRGLTDRLSANPIEDITLTTGIWALRWLLVTLAITPLRRITGWQRVIQYRRMLGLFAFFYASMHLLTYVVLDQGLAFEFILPDIVKRPYITMGMIAFTLMVPACGDVDQGMDPPSGAEVAAASSAGLLQRRGRVLALPLEGQGGDRRARVLRRHLDLPPGVSAPVAVPPKRPAAACNCRRVRLLGPLGPRRVTPWHPDLPLDPLPRPIDLKLAVGAHQNR